jgi:hypothetical protein
MVGTSSVNRQRLIVSAFAAAVLALPSMRAFSHPMPDTEITVSGTATAVNLIVRLPMHDLLLALPPTAPRRTSALLADGQRDLRAYFLRHLRVLDRNNRPVPLKLGVIALHQDKSPNVGEYKELEVRAAASASQGEPLTLVYDGIIHRVINHRALVHDRRGELIGIIRFELATKRVRPLPLPPGRRP